MNFAAIMKTVDALMAVRDVARRVRGNAPSSSPDGGLTHTPPGSGIGGVIETRLTNVVVAALREAFDRDRARLDLERDQYEEQRKRAEEAMRQELRRQATERELSRLRMLAVTALIGWVASVAVVVARLGSVSVTSRAVAAVGWLCLLGAMASAFSAQGRVGQAGNGTPQVETSAASVSLWLLTAGLAISAGSLLF
jgi:hypothetical protein